MKLTSALKAAEDTEMVQTSPDVRARLLSEVRAIARRRRQRTFVTLATAAALVVAIGLVTWRRMHPMPGIERSPLTIAPFVEATTPFFPLVPAAMPLTSTHLVRIDLPRRALASFGLLGRELDHSSSETVLADLMVGDDGLARAVRFVSLTDQEREP